MPPWYAATMHCIGSRAGIRLHQRNCINTGALAWRVVKPRHDDDQSRHQGGDRGPVAPAVFKTVVSLHGDGWVRLPFTSAILPCCRRIASGSWYLFQAIGAATVQNFVGTGPHLAPRRHVRPIKKQEVECPREKWDCSRRKHCMAVYWQGYIDASFTRWIFAWPGGGSCPDFSGPVRQARKKARAAAHEAFCLPRKR